MPRSANLLRIVLTIPKWFFDKSPAHTKELFAILDPIKTDNSKVQRNIKCRTEFAIFGITVLASYLMGIFGLEWDSQGEVKLSNLNTSPHPYSHQITIPSIWMLSDAMNVFNALISFLIYAIYSFHLIEQEDKMAMIFKGRILHLHYCNLSPQLSRSMLLFRQKFKYPLIRSFIFCMVTVIPYFHLNVYWNNVYQISLLSFLYWTTLFPLLFFYFYYATMGFTIFVILSNRYLVIWQQSELAKLRRINRKLLTKRLRSYQLTVIFREFKESNRTVLIICYYIRLYSQFWGPYISLAVPNSVFLLSCYLYVLFELNGGPLMENMACLFLVSLLAFLYLFTKQCSHVLKFNQEIVRENRRFLLAYQRVAQLPNRNLLKVKRVCLKN